MKSHVTIPQTLATTVVTKKRKNILVYFPKEIKHMR